jgi:hypothetical protein
VIYSIIGQNTKPVISTVNKALRHFNLTLAPIVVNFRHYCRIKHWFYLFEMGLENVLSPAYRQAGPLAGAGGG